MQLKPADKPTLQQIRQQAKTAEGQTITRQMIAKKAGLTYGDIYLIDIGGHLAEHKIRKVLWAFRELSGISLKSQDIRRGGSH